MTTLRRQVKNMVHNYTEAEVKVREATSNDPWGPSTSLMSEVSQMTYNAEAFPEVMIMVWRRLNDSGKNWRHVYKALTLLDYLIKTGSNKVAHECQENLITVQTLKDFQFVDREGKDQGINVREKAKQIVSLLKDGERLKQERAQAQNTRRRLSQGTTALSSNQKLSYIPASTSSSSQLSPDLEQARPQSSGEEELQLQLALAMSKEDAEKKQAVPSAPDADDELQLQTALSLSKEEHEKEMRSLQGETSLIKDLDLCYPPEEQEQRNMVPKSETHILELEDIFGPCPIPSQSSSSNIWDGHLVGSLPPLNTGPSALASHGSLFSAWGPTNQNHHAGPSLAWGPIPCPAPQLKENHLSQSIIFSSETDWKGAPDVLKTVPDPWGGTGGLADSTFDIFTQPLLPASKDSQSTSLFKLESPLDQELFGDSVPRTKPSPSDALDLTGLEESLNEPKTRSRCNTPESFLDPTALSLVNLDALISAPGLTVKNKNPFLSGLSVPSATNPFQLGDNKPSLNQMWANSSASGAAGAPMISMRNVSPVPGVPMGPGPSTLRALSPVPGFIMPPSTSLLLPLHSASPVLGLQSAVSSSYSQGAVLNQLPASFYPPLLPVSNPTSHSSLPAVNNPFL
ncbi:epsin-3 isoform X1 [Ascaphus truei]|uniref:epsin-3 isoform X1 n=1 Tax=Ascaphus truei TaxID=8439 RepID=UPI003F59B7FE